MPPSLTTEAKTLNLTALIERLEKANGPDRELDALIATTVGGYVYEKRGRDQKAWFYPVPATGSFRKDHYSIPRYSASIDAAVALAERVLPGWFFDHIGNDAIGEDFNMAWIGWTVEISPGMSKGFQGQAKTLPVAICLATLRALSAQEGSK